MRKKWNTENFIKWAKEIHGTIFDYSDSVVGTSKSMVTIICPVHGSFIQRASAHINMKQGCRKCADINNSVNNKDCTDSFLIKAKEVHGDKYDYSKVVYNGYGGFIIIICPVHGGFRQRAGGHTSGKGCKQCALQFNGNTLRGTTEGFIKKSKAIHGNKYDYSLVVYTTTHSTVKIVCPDHGVFDQIASNHMRGWCCPKCATLQSKGESELVTWLRSLDVHVIERSRKIIAPKELDLYLPDFKLAIEYNGIYWHSEDTGKGKLYHKNKTDACAALDIHLMQFWDFEWKHKKDIVKSIILNKLGMYKKRLFARKLQLRAVEPKVARNFCEKHHLHGFRSGSSYLGLISGKRLAALLIVASDGELVRYVVARNTTILGGFSRLLAHSTVTYSYVDQRVYTGSSYTHNGFILDKVTQPNYFYVHGGSYLGSRQQFQKNKLAAKLDLFDADLTEIQNMRNNGFSRVFDCGHIKFKRVQ